MSMYNPINYATFIKGSQDLPASVDSTTGGNTKRFGDDSEKYFAIYNFQAHPQMQGGISYGTEAGVGHPFSMMIKSHSDDMDMIRNTSKFGFEQLFNERTIIEEVKIRHAKKASETESASDDESIDYTHVRVIGYQTSGDEVYLNLLANAKKVQVTPIKEGVVGEAEAHVFDAGDTLGEPKE
ncbi:hypothetical protein ACGVWS_01850 [Enterobacteriaceae bacterium LUAb1]